MGRRNPPPFRPGRGKRPYFKARITDLEAIFGRSQKDPQTLRALHEELAQRKVPRALALREKVKDALAAAKTPSENSSSGHARHGRNDNHSHAPKKQTASPQRRSPNPGLEVEKPTGRIPAAVSPRARIVQNPSAEPTPQGETESGPAAADTRLAAWVAQEVLTPSPLPEAKDLQAHGQRLFRLEDHPDPWSDSRHAKTARERNLYWFLYLGEIDLEEATTYLLRLFPDEAAEERLGVRGKTTMAAVVLDAEGRPIDERVFLSSFPWGLGQVRAAGLRGLATFPEAEKRICARIAERLTEEDDEGNRLPVTDHLVRDVTSMLASDIQVLEELIRSHGLALRLPIRSKKKEAPEPELLNSFFLDDLSRVRKALASNDIGKALRQFLDSQPTRPMQDVRRNPGLIDKTVAPARMPLARWPMKEDHSLALMQQAAVNHAGADLAAGGLLGVNGPPGTGKTTLLRDLVANVVLDRAEILAAFDDPESAFSHVAPIKLGQGFMHLYQLDKRLLGHEILVASSNNKAVENISREIPMADALPETMRPSASYFASIADCVAAGGRDEDIVDGSMWGLAAAALGNKANCSAFARDFWWHSERGMQPYLRAVCEGWNPSSAGESESLPEVLSLEGAPQNSIEARKRWGEARKTFRHQLRRVKQMAGRLEAGRKAIQARATAMEKLRGLEEKIDRLTLECRDANHRKDQAMLRLTACRQALEVSTQRRTDHLLLRPGFLSRLFRTRRFREWRAKLEPILDQLASRQDAFHGATEQHQRFAEEAAERDKALSSLHTARDRLARDIESHEKTIREVEELTGGPLPEADSWDLESAATQTSSPWLGRRVNEARDALFATTFCLHRAFVDAAAPKLRHNLAAALAVIQGRGLSAKQEPARRSLWASLFLVVPVISTTFASAARLLGPLGREALGWLLIDEAGQALPQAAAGAIWRSCRVVVIGDPLQIEPVVPSPIQLTTRLFQEFGVEADTWAAPMVSAQILADRASWLGTQILRGDGDLWIGCPLRVHRRCEEPMFSISNHVAYGGLMVQATSPKESPIGNVLGESRWLHLQGQAQDKWSEEEGRVVVALLERLFENIEDPDVFVITPFRLVAQSLRMLTKSSHAIARRMSPSAWQWTQDRIGTVHTFQGKEAEAVILVLGAPLDMSAGARRWAGGSPNLLNVAVSRAKRRLYVVGNHDAWKNAGVFRFLASSIRAETTPPF